MHSSMRHYFEDHGLVQEVKIIVEPKAKKCELQE